MRSEFLDQEQKQYASGGVGALAGSLYYWSALDMLSSFSTTGEYFLPWSRWAVGKKEGLRVSAVNKSWGIRSAKGVAETKYSKAYRPVLFGEKFLGKGAFGNVQLLASQAAKFKLGMMTWTDPVFFSFRFFSQPSLAMGLYGATVFGGGAMWNSAARAMERTRYVDMSVMFPETQASFTSRQRAVRAISESHLQARSAIGNEAQLWHR